MNTKRYNLALIPEMPIHTRHKFPGNVFHETVEKAFFAVFRSAFSARKWRVQKKKTYHLRKYENETLLKKNHIFSFFK